MKYNLKLSDQVKFFYDKNILIDDDSNGDNINKKEVYNILEKRNYFFKLKIFSKAYYKDNKQKYIDVDFKSIHRFSILDTSFRTLILQLTLMCEHLLKTKINYLCTKNQDNGYAIVQQYINAYGEPNEIKRNLQGKQNYYTEGFMTKYKNNMAIWNLLEILTFSETIKFYNFYLNNYCKSSKLKIFELKPVNNLRNAAAHNTCMLYLLGTDMRLLNDIELNPSDKNEYSKNIKDFILKHNLNNNITKEFFIHDFLCLIYLLIKLCPNGKLKTYARKDICKFFKKCEKKKWFKVTDKVKEKYIFIKKSTLLMFRYL